VRTAAISTGSLLRGAAFHYVRLLGNGYRALREIEAALAAEPGERVLDFGCGSGGFCLAVPGSYLGIDLNPGYIAFARWRWASPRRRFELMQLDALPGDARFDRAMVINCVHHLSDAEASVVLGRLAAIVRRRVVVLDLDPGSSNRLQRFLLAHDRGDYIRPVARLRTLLAAHFAVVSERTFRNTPHTAVQVLFVSEPRG